MNEWKLFRIKTNARGLARTNKEDVLIMQTGIWTKLSELLLGDKHDQTRTLNDFIPESHRMIPGKFGPNPWVVEHPLLVT